MKEYILQEISIACLQMYDSISSVTGCNNAHTIGVRVIAFKCEYIRGSKHICNVVCTYMCVGGGGVCVVYRQPVYMYLHGYLCIKMSKGYQNKLRRSAGFSRW